MAALAAISTVLLIAAPGIGFARIIAMPTRTAAAVRPRACHAAPVLRWIFCRDNAAMTCEVRMRRTGACEVAVVPHWDPSQTRVEPFDGPAQALHRHAEIARELREAGWVVLDHVPVGRHVAA